MIFSHKLLFVVLSDVNLCVIRLVQFDFGILSVKPFRRSSRIKSTLQVKICCQSLYLCTATLAVQICNFCNMQDFLVASILWKIEPLHLSSLSSRLGWFRFNVNLG